MQDREKIREYKKKYYQKNKEKLAKKHKKYYEENKERVKEYQRNWYKEMRKWIDDYKIEKGCELCSENHPATLVFHHKDLNKKEFNIANFIRKGNKKKLLKEIEKCQVLCFNCHAILHWKEKNNGNNL